MNRYDRGSNFIGRNLARGTGSAAILIGLIAMLGWQLDSGTLKSVIPGHVTMKFNAALGIVLLGLAQILLCRPHRRFVLRAVQGLVALNVAISVATIFEYFSGLNLGIDEIFYKDLDRFDALYPPGRLAPITAVSFILIALAVTLIWSLRRPLYRSGQILLLVAAVTSFQALVGYVLGVQTSFGFAIHTKIAIPTAVAVIILCFGFFSLSAPHGYARILWMNSRISATTRRLLATVVLVPPLFSLIEKIGVQEHYFTSDFGILLRVVGNVVFFSLLVWGNAEVLHRSERKRAHQARTVQAQSLERERLLGEQRVLVAQQKSEAGLRAIFNSSFDGIIGVKANGEISEWNPRAEDIFGWGRSEVLGQDFVKLLIASSDQPTVRASFAHSTDSSVDAASEWSLVSLDVAAMKKSGRIFPVRLAIRPMALEGERVFYSFIEDISVRKRSEEELVEARQRAVAATRLKSEFLANMSHEIRTPLNGIIGMSKMLEKTALDTQQKEFLDTIETASNALLSLINNVLDFSKIEAGKLQLEAIRFELRSLVESAMAIVAMSAETKGVRLHLEIADSVPNLFMGDPVRLRQVLLNLLNNALKFTASGSVRLRISGSAKGETDFALRFDVIDTGIGIDPVVQAHLFQAFSQGDGSTNRSYGGTGLGLAISKQLVEAMEGSIGVDSRLGEGSCFHFQIVLRVCEADFDNVLKQPLMNKVGQIDGHVLLVEDQTINQKVIIAMLGMLGVTVKVAANGAEALERLRNESFALVLMDGQMPVMDGYEATRRIRRGEAGAENTGIVIIAITANAIKGDFEKCIDAGMNDYISKPIIFNDLALKLKSWLERGRLVIERVFIKRIQELEKKSPGLLKEMITIFGEDAARDISLMKEHIARHDLGAIQKLAHGLQSTCSQIGAFRMRALCERLERSEHNPPVADVLILMQALEREFVLASAELNSAGITA